MKNDGHVKVIIHYTGQREWLQVTVDSVLRQTDYSSFEIVISTNGDRVADWPFVDGPGYERVSLLESEKLLGTGEGRNVAASPGDAEYYVFLSPHCLVEQRDWLRRATESLERYPNVSMIQPEIVAFAYDAAFNPDRGLTISQLRLLRYEHGAMWVWPYVDSSRLADPRTVKCLPDAFEMMSGDGGVVVARAAMFHDLGKFDSEVDGPFQETMDYCIRAWMLGHPTMVDPSIRVYQRANQKPSNEPQAMLSLIHGRLRTAYKYLTPRRRDLAEILFRQHGFDAEVDRALELIRRGNWLSERAVHRRNRIHDDDWLFSKFEVYEEHFSGQPGPSKVSAIGC